MSARVPTAERVLIIDDDLMSREVLTLLLTSAGYTVATVPSGEAALTHLAETASQPDVILADIQMPGLSGSPLAEALRLQCRPEALLIAISGSGGSFDSVQGFDAFLLKPFQAAELAAVVEALQANRLSQVQSHGGGTASFPGQASKLPMSAQPHTAPTPSFPPRARSTPELDDRIYRQLREAMPGSQLQQMYGMCLDDVRKRITSMRALAEDQNGEQFVRQAHAIKGGCGMLGASELYTMASRLEKAGLPSAGLQTNSGVNPLDELWSACDRLERILGSRTEQP